MGFARKINRARNQRMTKAAMRRIKEYEAHNILYKVKYDKVMEELKKEWIREVNIHVPRWAQVLSLFTPPKVYSKVFFTLWPRDCFQKYQNEITKKAWPAWRKWLNKFACAAVFNAVKFIFHDWMLYLLKYPLRTWGTRRVIYRETPEKIVMKIYLWRQEVYSTVKEIKML